MPWFMTLLRRLGLNRWFFTLMYLRGRPPWDSGTTPPELVAAVEGAEALPAGRALDIGCGTGTNSLYLARHGWDVTGVDFVPQAIARARRKASAAGEIAGAVRFVRGDATRLDALELGLPCTLLFDQGCLHGIPAAGQQRYAAGLARAAAPGALYLLYAFAPRILGTQRIGLAEEDVRTLFAPFFALERVARGSDRGGVASAWYWLRRADTMPAE